MAKVKLPLMSSQAEGKVGDIVYMRRGDFGINVVRMRVKPRNPRTPAQEAVRHNIKVLSQIWKTGDPKGKTLYKWDNGVWVAVTISNTETFTDADKETWKMVTAQTKGGYKLNGRYAFLSINLKRLKDGMVPFKRYGVVFQTA